MPCIRIIFINTWRLVCEIWVISEEPRGVVRVDHYTSAVREVVVPT